MADQQTIDPQSLPTLTEYYKIDPSRFSPDQAQRLQSAAKDAGYSFDLAPQHRPQVTFGTMLKQFGSGILQGFTTINVGNEPTNSSEAIAHSIGEVAGLVGLIPNPAGWVSKGGWIASRLVGVATAERWTQTGKAFLSLGSPVTHAAGWIEKGIEKSVLNAPIFEGIKLLEKTSTSRHIIDESIRMGLIGAISAKPFYELDVASRVNAFIGMAPMGAVNGFLGIQINKYGKWDVGKALGLADVDQAKLTNNVARAIASGIALGMPATLRGEPAEMQIYDYLLNGYFGYKQPSLIDKQTLDFINPLFAHGDQHKLTDPQSIKGWEKLSPEVQAEVTYESRMRVGRRMQPQWLIADARLHSLYDTITKDGVDPMKYAEANLLTIPEAQAMRHLVEVKGAYDDFLKIAKKAGLDDQAAENQALDRTGKRLVRTGEVNKQQFLDELLAAPKTDEEALSNAMVMQNIIDYNEAAQTPHSFLESLYKFTGSTDFATSETKVKQAIDLVAKNIHQQYGYDHFVKDIAEAFPEVKNDPEVMREFRREWWRAEGQEKTPQATFSETQGLKPFGVGGYSNRGSKNEYIGKWSALSPQEELTNSRAMILSTYESVVDGKLKVVPIYDASVPRAKIISKLNADGWQIAGLVKDKGSIRLQRPVIMDNSHQTADGKATSETNPKLGGNKRVYDILDAKGKPSGEVWIMDLDAASRGDKNFIPDMAVARAQYLKEAGIGSIGYWDTPPDPSKVGIIGTNYNEAEEGKYTGVSVQGGLGNSKTQRLIDHAIKGNKPFYFSRFDKVDKKVIDYITQRGGDIITDLKYNDGVQVATDSFSEGWVALAWESNFAHNLYAYQKMNGDMPLDKIFGGGKGFLHGVRSLVQRNQILWSSDIHIAADEMAKELGLPDGKLRVALLQHDEVANKAYNHQYIDPETGKAMDTVTDGVFSLRSDVFDALLKQVGLDLRGGSAKGSFVDSSDPTKGVFIGKLLYHRASPELEAHLKANDLHGEIWTTAAKAYGSRVPLTPEVVNGVYGYRKSSDPQTMVESLGLKFDGNQELMGKNYVQFTDLLTRSSLLLPQEGLTADGIREHAQESRTKFGKTEQLTQASPFTTVDLKAIRMNPTWGEDSAPSREWDDKTKKWKDGASHALQPVEIVKQLHGNLSGETLSRFLKDYVIPARRGTSRGNGVYRRAYAIKDPVKQAEAIKKLNIDDVGLEDQVVKEKDGSYTTYPGIISIMKRGQMQDTPLYQHVARKVLKLDERIQQPSENMDQDAVDRFTEIQSLQSSVRGILKIVGIHPAALNLISTVSRYQDMMLIEYVKNRLETPKIFGSTKAVIYGQDIPELMKRGALKMGTYMLSAGYKGMMVEWPGTKGKMRLEDAFKAYQAAVRDGSITPEQEKSMRHLVGRVPADSASGFRVLQFVGFTERPGFGTYLHPEDYRNIGGADNDGDTAFIYTKISDSVKDYYSQDKIRDQWYTFTGAKGELSAEEFYAIDNLGMPKISLSERMAYKREFIPTDHHPELKAKLTPEQEALYKGHASMFDPSSLMEINRAAYQGNANLGYGMNAKIAMKTALIRAGAPQSVLDALEAFGRENVNRSADAIQHDPMISRNELGALYEKFAIDYAKGIGKNPENILADFEKIKEAQTVWANGKDKMGNRPGFHTWLRELNERLPYNAKTGFEPHSYSAMQSLVGDLYEQSNPFSDKGWTSIMKAKDELGRRLGANSRSGVFARRLLGIFDFAFPLGENWTHSARFLYRFYNAKGDEVDAKQALATSEKDGTFMKDAEDNFVTKAGFLAKARGIDERNDLANQLLGQDYADLTTMVRTLRIAEDYILKDPNLKESEYKVRQRQVTNVINKANEFKMIDVERINARRNGEDVVTDYDEMVKVAIAYRNKLSEPFKLLFDTWYLGSLRQQEQPLGEVLVEAAKQRTGIEHKIEIANAIVPPNVAEIKRLKNALFLKSDYQVEKAWRSTNLGGSQWLYPWISDVAKKGWMDEFAGLTSPAKYGKEATNRVQQVLDDKWTDVERASKKIEGTGIPVTEMNGTVQADLVEDRFKSKFQRLVEEAAIGSQETDPKRLAEETQLREDVRKLVYNEPALGRAFEELFAGTLAKTRWSSIGRLPEVATLEDVRDFVDAFKVKGHFWHDLQNLPPEQARKRLRWYHFFGMPERIGESILANDHTVITNNEGLALTKDGLMIQPIKFFQSHLGQLVEFGKMSHRSNEAAIGVWQRQIRDEFQVVDNLNTGYGNKLGTRLMEMAATRIEIGRVHESDTARSQLAREWRDMEVEYSSLKDKTFYMKDTHGQRIPLTGEQIIVQLEGKIRTAMERGRLLMNNPEGERKYIVEENGEINVQFTLKAIQEARMAGTMDNIGENGIRRIAHQLMTNRFQANYQLRKDAGTTEAEQSKYLMDMFPGLKREQFTLQNGSVYFSPLGELSAPVRKVLKEKMLEFVDATGGKPFEWLRYTPKDLHDVANYFPHLLHDRAKANSYLEAKIKAAGFKDALDPGLSDMQIRTIWQYAKAHSPSGGEDEAFMSMLNEMGEMPAPKMADLKVPQPLDGSTQPPNYWDLSSTKGRSQDDLGLMPGWEKTVHALEFYGSQKIQGYHNMLYTLMSNQIIGHFEKGEPMGADTKPWASFMKMYSRQVVGQPSLIPEEFLKNKDFKAAINPYRVFSDQFWLERLRQINKKFDLKPGEKIDIKDVKNLGGDQAMLRKIVSLSNLEAKWELLTLLSHTKTMVNNLAGANTNSAIEVGFSPLRAAWSFNTMQQKVRSLTIDGVERTVRSQQDLWDFAEQHGGMETFVARQIDWNPDLQTTAWAGATKEMLELARTKGFKGLTAEQFGALAKKHGIGDAIMEKAAWFMKVTEVSNRRRAWWAGYLKAMDMLEGTSYSYKSDDPWLIHIANRTVEATQFLYNNASRPMFAATNIGKIFTRFQLYAYNSLSFRGNILRMAKQANYKEGSEEMNRFTRMAGMDLFVLAMASLFPASLFDASLMQPWQTFQGVTQMLFGSDEEKKKAFFGTLPYPANIIQPISPPITRAIYPVITGLLTGEWDRFSSYTAWTLAPFGRLAKDLNKTIENPTMILENSMGIPVHKMTKLKAGAKKTEVIKPIPGLVGSAWRGF